MTEAVAALAVVTETARLDAEVLLAHAAGVERDQLVSRGLSDAPGFAALVVRRLKGEPVAYITGTRGFWTIDLDVTPDVLIPRPDSETLIDAAVAHFGKRAPARVLDLGTGSGALLLAALDQWPGATGLGIDASEAALVVARRNGGCIAPGRASFGIGDWAEGIDEPFDLILCNPPYIEDAAVLGPGVREWEPHSALFAGDDGLDCYRILAGQIPRVIALGGVACIELGAGQAAAVAALFADSGLTIGTRRDLGGHERCLMLT
ncbi:peptide chain release factor N(5)-glutamine methyltransferase [Sphingomonas antarctica]|uniref:peptide chain release factor N(5)-glutamine methyltransferase n=1 Tax=Sphingomonas antarctica TaxID=2040274 RepID=UPI0039E78F3C